MSAEPKRVELTEAERADLDSWAASGIYLCDASDPCAGYHDQRPGHEHENLFDAVAELIATREAAARREALLEAREDIRERRRRFAGLGCDEQYLLAMDDCFGLVNNRLSAALADQRDERSES